MMVWSGYCWCLDESNSCGRAVVIVIVGVVIIKIASVIEAATVAVTFVNGSNKMEFGITVMAVVIVVVAVLNNMAFKHYEGK